MHSIIKILDDTTINQIAAGEVIENPASVIKELIENALDADSTSIFIEISASGRHMIRVSDNGMGMNHEDALLCFQRHATSKVRKIEDLDSLASLGFRGEALPSIAAISKVRLITRQRDSEQGALVEIHGGKLLTHTEVPCNSGTLIEVLDLFYNMPARKKFLKSIRQDFVEIQKIVMQIAYGNPLVHFSLISDGEKILDLPLVTHYLDRARQLLHENSLESMFSMEFREGEIAMEGLISYPTFHRPNKTGQHLFINQRPVYSWEIAQAVLEAYGTSLPERRFPLFHLHLNLPPHEFDVNVHPQKKEVRFCHLEHLKEVIRRGISKALSPSFKEEKPTEYQVPEQTSWKVSEPSPYFAKEIPIPLPLQLSTPLILGIIPFYIVLEQETGIQLLDIQRAKKRIIYETVLHQNKPVEKQLLLIPLTLNFSEEETALLIDQSPQLESIGFTIRPFGKLTFLIESFPSFIREKEVEGVLHEMIRAKDQWALLATQRIEREKRILTPQEAGYLVKELFACQQPYFTPSAEPILAQISFEDLRRFFK